MSESVLPIKPETAESDLHERYFGHEHETIIEPQKGWRALDLKELWAYRELLLVLTMRDVKVRYKQTVLGFTWAIIQPVMMMVVFSIFFGRLAQMPSDGFPYPIFVYAGLLPWTFFANAIGTSGSSLIGSAQLVSKVYFPRLIIPLASIGAGLIDLAISTCILLALMAWYGVGCEPEPADGTSSRCGGRVHGAGGWHVPVGAHRRLSRFPLRDPIHDPILDVRHARGLPSEPGTCRLALAALPQPDGRHN